MTFDDIWNNADLETLITVSKDGPPPSVTSGVAYQAWRSHNFTGTLEDKVTKNGWRYLRFEVLSDTTPDEVEYLAYEVADGLGHAFTIEE